MNRRQFIKTAAVCAASGVAAPETLLAAQKTKGKTVRGKVVENKGPVVGVMVSDGLNCVRTDEKKYVKNGQVYDAPVYRITAQQWKKRNS